MRSVIARPGSLEPLVLDVAAPQPGPQEVVLDVVAAAVNPVDTLLAADGLGYFGLTGDVGLGWDVSGRVAAVGAEVPDRPGLRVGDPVVGLDTALAAGSRAQAQQVVLPADAVALLPVGLDLAAAASIPLNLLTADQALNLLGPAEGRTLLVTGAAGAVGGYALPLAVAAGWRVTGWARATDAAFVTGTGAEHLTDPGERRFDAVLDAAALHESALAHVRDGGQHVSVQPVRALAAERGVTVQAVMVHADGRRLAALLERSVTGELAVRVAGSSALEEAATAYAKVAGGGLRGRWLLLP